VELEPYGLEFLKFYGFAEVLSVPGFCAAVLAFVLRILNQRFELRRILLIEALCLQGTHVHFVLFLLTIGITCHNNDLLSVSIMLTLCNLKQLAKLFYFPAHVVYSLDDIVSHQARSYDEFIPELMRCPHNFHRTGFQLMSGPGKSMLEMNR